MFTHRRTFTWTAFRVSVWCLFALTDPVLGAEDVNAAKLPLTERGIVIRGAVTNSLCAEVVVWGRKDDSDYEIEVFVRHCPEAPTMAQSASNRLLSVYFQPPISGEATTNQEAKPVTQPGASFFLSPYGFCGPIELTSEGVTNVALRNPLVSDPKMYPDCFRFSELKPETYHRRSYPLFYSGPGWPEPLLTPRPKLGRFLLREQFDIPNPARYVLVVSPKIYERSPEDPDLCNRVDLPPITIPIVIKKSPK